MSFHSNEERDKHLSDVINDEIRRWIRKHPDEFKPKPPAPPKERKEQT